MESSIVFWVKMKNFVLKFHIFNVCILERKYHFNTSATTIMIAPIKQMNFFAVKPNFYSIHINYIIFIIKRIRRMSFKFIVFFFNILFLKKVINLVFLKANAKTPNASKLMNNAIMKEIVLINLMKIVYIITLLLKVKLMTQFVNIWIILIFRLQYKTSNKMWWCVQK